MDNRLFRNTCKLILVAATIYKLKKQRLSKKTPIYGNMKLPSNNNWKQGTITDDCTFITDR